MVQERIVDKPDVLREALAARFEREERQAQAARGRFAIALPGGSVARLFFPRLAAVRLDWSRADFFWGDERAVPPSHPDSNYGLARALWLDPAGVPAESIHRLIADAPDLAGAADTSSDELVRVLATPPRLDLALLGAGPDGHVCSLFPGHALLREERRWVAAIQDAPKPPPRRLTLTLRTLGAARLIVVAALGEEKAAAVREALEDETSGAPLAIVARRAQRIVFVLDPAAASLLAHE